MAKLTTHLQSALGKKIREENAYFVFSITLEQEEEEEEEEEEERENENTQLIASCKSKN